MLYYTLRRRREKTMADSFTDWIMYFYMGTIVVAAISYLPQQIILINMLRGKIELSNAISNSQYIVWFLAYVVATLYAVFIVKDDLPLIVLNSINLLHTFLTTLLNSYVQYLYKKHDSSSQEGELS